MWLLNVPIRPHARRGSAILQSMANDDGESTNLGLLQSAIPQLGLSPIEDAKKNARGQLKGLGRSRPRSFKKTKKQKAVQPRALIRGLIDTFEVPSYTAHQPVQSSCRKNYRSLLISVISL